MSFVNFLLYILLIGNVILRVFTNYLQVLPKVFNIFDVFVTLAFAVFFILSGGRIKHFKNILYLLLVFNIVCLLGTLLNLEYFYYPAALAQLIMYNEPIVLFLVLVNLPFKLKTINTFTNIMYILIGLQIILGIVQVPLFITTGDSEQIIGTFPGNGEQYGTIMLLGIFLLLALTVVDPKYKFRNYSLAIISMVLIILVDNKASWIGIAASLLYMTSRLLGTARSIRYRLNIMGIGIALFCIAYGVAKESSTFAKINNTVDVLSKGKMFEIGKLSAYKDVLQAFSDHTHMVLFGSGLGSFYSRSSFQFYDYGQYLNSANIHRRYLNKEQIIAEKAAKLKRAKSNSMGGIITKSSRDPFYAQYYDGYKEFHFIGSGQVDNPFSSYNGLLGETGFLGIFLYLAIYWIAIKRINKTIKIYRHNKIIFPMGIAALGIIVYLLTVSVYGMWLDTGRLNTIVWMMTALLFRYDCLLKRETLQFFYQTSSSPENIVEPRILG